MKCPKCDRKLAPLRLYRMKCYNCKSLYRLDYPDKLTEIKGK